MESILKEKAEIDNEETIKQFKEVGLGIYIIFKRIFK